MDLPTGPFTELGQQAIEIVGSLLGTPVGTDMAGLQSIPDRQQIHTNASFKP
jgi:hypothetical protein